MKNRLVSARVFAVWVSVFILAYASQTQSASWVPLDKSVVAGQSRSITIERYPDADSVVVDQQAWTKYRTDGTYTAWFEQYVKVLTEKGRRNLRTLSSSFNIPYNTTRFTLVEVIAKDGSTQEVDIPQNSREMVDNSQMASNIYDPNARVLQVGIPGLEVGDVVHFITMDEYVKARMPGQWSDFFTFEETDPIKSSRYIVVAPKVKPLKSIALKAEIPGTITHTETTEGEEIIYQWVAKDVPRAFEEPAMPPLYTQAQRLLVSTIPDWKTISSWYWNLSRPHLMQTTPEMGKTVNGIIKGTHDRRKIIEGIFFWVSHKIRYLGIVAETEAPGYEPHPVAMTFERRAGVCRDKAALLVAMLRLAGYEAYPVLIMNGPKKDPEVPQPFFNHAIACVKNRDGSYQLMDPTDENTKDLFPAYLNNQSYLVATPGGEDLHTSPIAPAEKNLMRIATKGRIDARGVLTAETSLSFEGINDNAYRGYFSMLSEEERKSTLEKMLKKVVPAALLEKLDIRPENMLDTTRPLQISIGFSAQGYPVHGRDMTMLPVFRFGDSIGMTNFLISQMGLKERRYTYMTETACGVDETLDIDLDNSLGKAVSSLLKDASRDEGSTWVRSIEVKDRALKARNLFLMKLPEYTPADYKHLEDTLKRVEKANRYMVALSKDQISAEPEGMPWYAAYKPDAVVLVDSLTVDIIDETSMKERNHKKIKVLTYAGKKKHSEVRIPYNPVWEDVRMVKASVTSPGGQIKEINPNEINIMDQEWVGRAPRYPAGKVLVASLPNLQEGSTIEYELVREKKDMQPFLIMSGFQGEDPIEKKTLRINCPDGLKMKMAKADNGFIPDSTWRPFPKGLIDEKRIKEAGMTCFEYSAGLVPPIKQEDNLPPGYTYTPTVIASLERTKDYAQLVRDALEKAASSQRASADKAIEITKAITNEDQKIIVVRDFVAKTIKPVHIGIIELPLSRISPADRTLADGYGNSADTAVILAAMLKAIGYEPEFMLTCSASPLEALQRPIHEFMASDWFLSVLVKIKTDQGEIVLGDTDQYATLGTVGASHYPALETKSGEIKTVHAADDQLEDKVETTITIDVSRSGDAIIRQKRSLYGMDNARFRKDYLEMSPEELRRRFQEIVSAVSRSGEPISPYTVVCDTYPATDEFSVKVPGYAVRDGDLLTIELPGLNRGLSLITGDERSSPLYRGTFRRHLVRLEVLLPSGVETVQLSPPVSSRFQILGAGEITTSTRVVQQAGDRGGDGRMRIVVEQETVLTPAFIMPERYQELLNMHAAISNAGMRTIVVRMIEGK